MGYPTNRAPAPAIPLSPIVAFIPSICCKKRVQHATMVRQIGHRLQVVLHTVNLFATTNRVQNSTKRVHKGSVTNGRSRRACGYIPDRSGTNILVMDSTKYLFATKQIPQKGYTRGHKRVEPKSMWLPDRSGAACVLSAAFSRSALPSLAVLYITLAPLPGISHVIFSCESPEHPSIRGVGIERWLKGGKEQKGGG